MAINALKCKPSKEYISPNSENTWLTRDNLLNLSAVSVYPLQSHTENHSKDRNHVPQNHLATVKTSHREILVSKELNKKNITNILPWSVSFLKTS